MLKLLYIKLTGIKPKFIITFLLLASVPLSAAGIYGINYSVRMLEDTTLHHLGYELSSKADDIEKFLKTVHRDASFLSQTVVMRDIADSRAPVDSKEFYHLRERLERVSMVISETRPYYYQIRYLNEYGYEVVRIDSDGNRSTPLPYSELQYKGDRYYFIDAMKYQAGQCYVSPMDLNVERGVVEVPYKPVVRVATPVFNSLGQKKGIVIINIFASYLIEQMQKLNIAEGGITFLANKDGFYLSHPNIKGLESKSFHVGHMRDDYPDDTVRAILSGRPGTIRSAGEIISYIPIFTGDAVSNKFWVLTIVYPKKAIFAAVFSQKVVFVTVWIVAILTAVVVGVWMSERLINPILDLHQGVEWIAEGDFNHRLAIKTGDEIESLADRFNSMTENLKVSRDRLQNWNESLQTEVRNRTRELEIEKNKLENVLMCASEGIIVADEEGRIVVLNPAAEAILGVKRDNMLGKGIMGCHRNPGKVKAILSGEIPPPVHAIATSLGSKQLEVTVALMSSGGEKVGSMMVMRDVTERQKHLDERMAMEKQLFHADKLVSLGELSAGIAHEIGNPLAAIKTVIQSMDEVAPLIGEQKKYMKRILKEIDRLNHFIKAFAAFAHPRVPIAGRCRVEQVLSDVLFLVKNEAGKHGISIEEKKGRNIPEILLDADQLKQVFINIMVNAIQAMPDGGKIRINIEQADEGAINVSISDTGGGIPHEDIERIFDPFYTTKPTGTGLGLSIVHKLLRDNNGDIKVRSIAGEGTTFELILPAAG